MFNFTYVIENDTVVQHYAGKQSIPADFQVSRCRPWTTAL